MRHPLFASALLGLSLALASLSASAVESTDLRAIHQQQLEYRQDAQAGERDFKDMSDVDRRDFMRQQDELFALIEGKSTLDELQAADQVRAHNMIENLQAILLRSEDLKMVCEYTKKTGSHRKTKVCMTAGERRLLREASQAEMQRSMGNARGENL